MCIRDSGSYTYTPASGYGGNDSFVIRMTDSHGASTTVTVFVSVFAPPVNHLPGTGLKFSDAPARVKAPDGSTFSVSDADSSVLWVRMRAGRGYLSMPKLTGLDLLEGTGLNDRTIYIHGPVAAINDALAQMIYQAPPGFFGCLLYTSPSPRD